MREQPIEVVARQRAAIPAPLGAEVAMTSPYLDHIRSTRKIIEALIVAREIELAKTTSPEQQIRLEQELSFLRDELARIGGRGCRERRR